MKSIKKKLATILILLSITALLFTITAFAEDADDGYIVWSISDDEKTLSSDTKTYTRVELLLGLELENKIFEYMNPITVDGEKFWILGTDGDDEIVYLNKDDALVAYATEAGKADLDAFFGGSYNTSRLYSATENKITTVESSFVSVLDALSTGAVTTDVRNLSSCERYEIWNFNSDDNLRYVHGAIYILDGESYYLNYQRLPNNNFDAHGNFSYFKGNVDIYPLSDTENEMLSTAHDAMQYYYRIYDSEQGNTESTTPVGGGMLGSAVAARIVLVVIIVLLGIIFPVLPIVFALISLFKWKTNHPIPAYIIFGASLIWAIIGIIILVIVLI